MSPATNRDPETLVRRSIRDARRGVDESEMNLPDPAIAEMAGTILQYRLQRQLMYRQVALTNDGYDVPEDDDIGVM